MCAVCRQRAAGRFSMAITYSKTCEICQNDARAMDDVIEREKLDTSIILLGVNKLVRYMRFVCAVSV